MAIHAETVETFEHKKIVIDDKELRRILGTISDIKIPTGANIIITDPISDQTIDITSRNPIIIHWTEHRCGPE